MYEFVNVCFTSISKIGMIDVHQSNFFYDWCLLTLLFDIRLRKNKEGNKQWSWNIVYNLSYTRTLDPHIASIL